LGIGISRDEAEHFLGVSSDEELRAKLGLAPEASPEESAALQALRDLELEERVVEIAIECDLSTREPREGRFRERRLRALEAAPTASPEAQGQAAARLLRQDLGLDGQPLQQLEELLASFDIQVEDRCTIVNEHDHTVAGAHRDGSGKVVVLGSPQTERPWSRRMEVCRSAGHLLLDAAPAQLAIGAGSSTRAIGPRRRRSGAFAAELLLPHSAIWERSGGVLDAVVKPEIFQGLMNDYAVGATTAAWQCYNAGLLSSPAVVEELISTYGSRPAGTSS